jgi:hypothetical protein
LHKSDNQIVSPRRKSEGRGSKSEGRNPKAERSPKSEIRTSPGQIQKECKGTAEYAEYAETEKIPTSVLPRIPRIPRLKNRSVLPPIYGRPESVGNLTREDWAHARSSVPDANGVIHTSPGRSPGKSVERVHCRPTACLIPAQLRLMARYCRCMTRAVGAHKWFFWGRTWGSAPGWYEGRRWRPSPGESSAVALNLWGFDSRLFAVKNPLPQTLCVPQLKPFRISGFGLLSAFGLRISDFPRRADFPVRSNVEIYPRPSLVPRPAGIPALLRTRMSARRGTLCLLFLDDSD